MADTIFVSVWPSLIACAVYYAQNNVQNSAFHRKLWDFYFMDTCTLSEQEISCQVFLPFIPYY